MTMRYLRMQEARPMIYEYHEMQTMDLDWVQSLLIGETRLFLRVPSSS